jgi:hypothetical protein
MGILSQIFAHARHVCNFSSILRSKSNEGCNLQQNGCLKGSNVIN